MMTTKLKNYIQLAGQTAAQVTQNSKNWTGFLTTASRLYRYPFPDQLMIHAQRPKATACAEYDLWNRRMSRYVRRGSKGIGLVGISHTGYPKLRYVFDIADTGKRNESANLFQWQYKEEYHDIITKALEERFGVSKEKGLSYQIELLSAGLANGYWKKHSMDIMHECEGSLLEGLEEEDASMKFRLAAAASIFYVLLARCGFDPWQYLKSENFKDIPDFNSQKAIRVLGAAVSQSSEKVLRTIAVAIYSYEYQKQEAKNISKPVQPQDKDTQPSEDSVQEPEQEPEEAIAEPENSIQDNVEPEIATLESQPVDYQVGDTVYLEDTAYEITDIGMFDVELRDPSQRYPIFRKENKDYFSDMLKRDPRNSKQHTLNTEESDSVDEEIIQDTEVIEDTEVEIIQDAEVIQNEAGIQEESIPEPCNFIITDDHLGEGGPKAKFRMNMEAITLLKQIESEGRTATPDEQQVLSKYVGWGGIPDAFEPDRAGWKEEYQELKEALTSEEYDSAQSSVLNAHYTSPTVIRAIYQAVGSMGFKSGNILEPSCGIGNFFGLLPEEMSQSKLYGVELDGISGRIARLLYPNVQIHAIGYEKTDFQKDFFDLAIGNVPFGQYKVNDPEYNSLGFSIHNYFLAKSLDRVRPGGILAFITTRYTMDSQNTDVSEYYPPWEPPVSCLRAT